MNRMQRRELAKKLRKENGFTKEQAKEYVNENFLYYKYSKGDKVKLDFKKIVKHPIWKKLSEEFRQWIIANQDKVLTIDGIFEKGHILTFEEDASDPKHDIRLEFLLPVASAMIKLNDGTEKTIELEGVTSANDPKINEIINNALENEEVK